MNDVKLTPIERLLVDAHARAVGAFYGEVGMTGRPVESHLTLFEQAEVGFGGEMAVAKAAGVLLQWQLGGDCGVDLTIGGRRCQVKTSVTVLTVPQLYFVRLEDLVADVAIYVQRLAPDEFRVWGCMSRAKFLKVHYVKTFRGYGTRYCVDASDLAPIEVLTRPEDADFWRQYDQRSVQHLVGRRYPDPPEGAAFCPRCKGGGCRACDFFGWMKTETA